MRAVADAGHYGRVFNDVAEEYARHRPTYPDDLIDRACEAAGIGPGTPVLEVGCGTGQLTGGLLARGLRVTAVEPGARLIERAHSQLDGAGEVQFVNAALEDVALPHSQYAALFSASAFHWADPDVSWRKAADLLVSGGTLALVSHFGLREPRSAEDQEALRAAMARVAPESAADWPVYRDLPSTLAGVSQRRGNVSEVWAWLGSYEVARAYAARLFEDVQVAVVPTLFQHTADELNALLATMSFWARLSCRQREALAAESHALHKRLARPIRSSTIACIVTARRAPSS